MALNLKELREWPPEIADLARSAREAATNHTNSADFYRSLTTASTWEGDGGDAARAALVASAGDHEAVADNLGKAATGMERVHQDAENLADTIKRILDDAAAEPAVAINESTNQVVPPDTSYMTEEYAAQVAAKVTDLQERIAAALADGERIDAELAGAITTATGAAEPAVKTSLQDLLLPSDQRDAPEPGEPPSTPGSLDGALDQLTGGSGNGAVTPKAVGADGNPAAGPVPLDPKTVETFKETTRQLMLQNGVPPDQIEQQLDALVAAAQRPQPANTPPEPGKMPPPSFRDGFADGWFSTEKGIKDMVGANGWEEFKDSWTDMAKGSWERITNPVEYWKQEAEHATKYPGHYLGEKSGETALTAPAMILGGEGALARAAAIPDDLIDMPSPTDTVDHPAPTPLADVPNHGTHAPIADAPPPPPLPPESPLFDGYDPIPPGPEFTNADGSLIYPDDSLPDKPYAIPGTVVPDVQLPAGTELGRWGYPGGTYLAPEGTPFAELSLPPDSAGKPYFRYAVDDPTALPPGWRIEQSQAAPWFHQPGGGPQYRVIAPDGVEPSVESLRRSGYLKRLGE